MATEVLAAARVMSFTNYYTGDPYIGSRDSDLKKKNEEIAVLQRENRRLKQDLSSLQNRVGSSRYSSGGRREDRDGGFTAPAYTARSAKEKRDG